jgi:hypothetical protein
VELKRIYLETNHAIIFQEEQALRATIQEKAAVRASPALKDRTGTKPTELEAPVPEA